MPPASDDLKIRANRLLLLYLEHSYRYYELDEPVISDGAWEQLCKELYELFHYITSPALKQIELTPDDLLAGTGYHLNYIPIAKLIESTMRWREKGIHQLEGY